MHRPVRERCGPRGPSSHTPLSRARAIDDQVVRRCRQSGQKELYIPTFHDDYKSELVEGGSLKSVAFARHMLREPPMEMRLSRAVKERKIKLRLPIFFTFLTYKLFYGQCVLRKILNDCIC